MNDYKSTVNLPATGFPMRGNLTKIEPIILARWIRDDLYGIVRNAKKGKKMFILHDGPPYANGNIHIGHSVNKILKDMIIKSKILSGFDSPYIPGWDCHGLPIELKVEQKYGKPGEKINTFEFRNKCREYAKIQVNNQREDFIRLGILGDWLNPYLTMDFKIEANIIRTLGKVINNGYLYRGSKPIHWCMNCRSSLAEAEIEYYEKISPSVYILFEASNQGDIKCKLNLLNTSELVYLVIWTTTPWTLPANRAISLSPDFKYALVKIEGKILILAKDLVKSVMKCAGINNYVIFATLNSIDLELMYFKHPFFNFNVPVILSSHVTIKIGTGVVHIAGDHGSDDYKVSQKYGIKTINLVGIDGTYLSGTHPALDGINVFNANAIIINMIRDSGNLFHVENIQHSYPYCWRHKTPIIFRVTSQWFININHNKLREQSLEKIKNVEWFPHRSRTYIESMVKNRPDWCISRQHVWGVPISLFIHKKTKNLHPCTLEIIEEVAKRVETNGIQAWWDLNPYDIIGNDADLYEKVSDTLDVWFDSGSTHTSVVNVRPEFAGHTADMYLEGYDQHRGWFMSSLMVANAIKSKIPYHQVLTHGFIVDEFGRKMSKSNNNAVSPQDIINNLGADILRLWTASTDYTSEMSISDKILKHTVDSYRRIRNTARFMLANLNDFNPDKNIVKPEEMIVLDRWAVSCTKLAQKNIINAYTSYDFNEVVRILINFCSIKMGSFYLDIIKDRQYTAKTDSLARRSCQTALYHILEAMVRWIAPIISFTADEIWGYLPGIREKYVFTNEWYKGLFSLDKEEFMNDKFWSEIIKLRIEVNKIIEQERTNKKLGSSLEARVTLYAENELAKRLNMIGKELKFILLTSDVKIVNYSNITPNAKQSESLKGLKISISKASGKKCLRCWHYTDDVGITSEHSSICKRCITNIVGNGECRRFA